MSSSVSKSSLYAVAARPHGLCEGSNRYSGPGSRGHETPDRHINVQCWRDHINRRMQGTVETRARFTGGEARSGARPPRGSLPGIYHMCRALLMCPRRSPDTETRGHQHPERKQNESAAAPQIGARSPTCFAFPTENLPSLSSHSPRSPSPIIESRLIRDP